MMAYTICDQFGEPKPLRLLLTNVNDTPRLGEPFTPFWWVCDPCNAARERYMITFRVDDQPQGYAWYQVITSDDSAEDIEIKKRHYATVIEARKAADAAQREWERLNA